MKIDRVNVLVYIYVKNPFRLLILRRTSDPKGAWQPVSGGVEMNEEFIDAVKREVFEETGLREYESIIDMEHFFNFHVPSSNRNMRDYCYGFEIKKMVDINLSHEHDLYKWVSQKEAKKILTFTENIKALDILLSKI